MTKDSAPEPVTFVAKRQEWLDYISGNNEHAVVRQINAMIWDAATFRIINKTRTLAPVDGEGHPRLNGMMHGLINRNFFTSQSLSIRRLTDHYPMQGERGVFSLVSVLKDMHKHAGLFTRSATFAAEGLSYDVEPIREKEKAYGVAQRKTGASAWHVPEDIDSSRIEDRHEQIDFLTRTSVDRRSRSDSIDPDLFTHLETKLTKCSSTVRERVNKFIAHASTPESRASAQSADFKVTLSDIWQAHEVICQIANFVNAVILGGHSHMFLIHSMFDQLQHLDRPLIQPHQVDELRDEWKKYRSKVLSWTHWGLREFESELDCSLS